MQNDTVDCCQSETVEKYISSDQLNLFPELGDAATYEYSKVIVSLFLLIELNSSK